MSGQLLPEQTVIELLSIPSTTKLLLSLIMSTPHFSLSRAGAADVEEIVALQYHCMPPFVRECFMGCFSEADLPRATDDFRHIMKTDPHDIWVKVTDTASGKIISASNWKIYPSSAPASSDDKPMPWLKGEQLEQSKLMLDTMNEQRRKANQGGYVRMSTSLGLSLIRAYIK